MVEFNFFDVQVVFQEVPDEVSLALTICGCPLRCEGCHRDDIWDPFQGTPLTTHFFKQLLAQYDGLITCVVFFGGEWQPTKLIPLLKLAQQVGLKTCLYTGMSKIPQRIKQYLTYLKTGAWQSNLGGLNSKITNQRFINVNENQLLNFKFMGS
ncbi:anaerobic ribonucleoside-triphosphate reductase activating protein [uncultured Shewanella sp.]|uniref:anaerobic ribonucleoside-triphosphate reductase activating protein n=1 Tax=uncultured Shewanella sp. TaxID=173975 RepID=UPI00262C1C1B|nr:anaerobic ribonucleoside-triphosphate reductase activating protein [uncultured Shewanella sp.]